MLRGAGGAFAGANAIDADIDAAVARVGGRGRLGGAGCAHGHPVGGDAVAGEKGGNGLGAGEAEHEVLLLGAEAVGMACNDQLCIGMLAEPYPYWQIALSLALMLFSIWVVIWFASRLYRVGILMYGKRATLPELLRWLRYS